MRAAMSLEADPRPNPVPVIVGTVVVVVLLVVAANVALWYQAQKSAPPRRAKVMGTKQKKREAMKKGLAPAGE
jgi:hypothetical protein